MLDQPLISDCLHNYDFSHFNNLLALIICIQCIPVKMFINFQNLIKGGTLIKSVHDFSEKLCNGKIFFKFLKLLKCYYFSIL